MAGGDQEMSDWGWPWLTGGGRGWPGVTRRGVTGAGWGWPGRERLLPPLPAHPSRPVPAELFQDLRQLQETWLTEGRLGSFPRLWVVSELCPAPLLCLPGSKQKCFFQTCQPLAGVNEDAE